MHTFLAAFSRNRSSADLQALVTRAERSMRRLLPNSAACGLPALESTAHEQRVGMAFFGLMPKENEQHILSTASTAIDGEPSTIYPAAAKRGPMTRAEIRRAVEGR